MSHKHRLTDIFGADRVKDDADSFATYGTDRTRVFPPKPSFIVFPKTVDEIRTLVRYCNEHKLAIVPSGGRTGYAGAAVAYKGEIVVSLNKMDRIISIDMESGSVDVEAGAILENVQKAVAEKGLYFPLDFAARGTAQIGGCISTNAGGIKVIKYGMTRELVLGLEAVTANGEVMNLNSNLHKNNSGYDLKQFFIGAEGTLGIITKATMKIVSPPKHLQVALLACADFDAVIRIIRQARLASLDITAFEFFTEPCLKAVLAHVTTLKNPFPTTYPFYALLEIDTGNDSSGFENLLAGWSESGLILDGTLAMNSQQFRDLWALREYISESISMLGNVHKNDIAVPIGSMPDFVRQLEKTIVEKYNRFEVLLFGHIGDGNIHVNVIDRSRMPWNEFLPVTEELDNAMCELIRSFGGSVSAEHGIGLLKRRLLKMQRSPQEIEWMKRIKHSIDPNNIFNPGKIIE